MPPDRLRDDARRVREAAEAKPSIAASGDVASGAMASLTARSSSLSMRPASLHDHQDSAHLVRIKLYAERRDHLRRVAAVDLVEHVAVGDGRVAAEASACAFRAVASRQIEIETVLRPCGAPANFERSQGLSPLFGCEGARDGQCRNDAIVHVVLGHTGRNCSISVH